MSEKAPCWHVPDSRLSRIALPLTFFLCVALSACSGHDPYELDALGSAALLVGTISPAERDAVVFVRANHDNGAFDDCTGTLLSSRVVITAKHCVNLVQAGTFVCNGGGTLMENGQGAGIFGAKLDPSRIEIHVGTAPAGGAVAHGAEIFTSESGDACHDDIAAVVLDTPIQQSSYPLLRSVRSTVVGERVRLVGYGTVNHGGLIERREHADVRVLDVGREDGVSNPNATTPARSFAIAGGTACFGDSGGPALSMDTGALLGVYSRISGDCFAVESRNTFVLASSFSALFAKAFEFAGEKPQLEPAPASTTSPVSVGGSGGMSVLVTSPQVARTTIAVGTGGAAASSTTLVEVTDPTAASRHGALRCAFAPRAEGEQTRWVVWGLCALLAAFTRRRSARGSFWAD